MKTADDIQLIAAWYEVAEFFFFYPKLISFLYIPNLVEITVGFYNSPCGSFAHMRGQNCILFTIFLKVIRWGNTKYFRKHIDSSFVNWSNRLVRTMANMVSMSRSARVTNIFQNAIQSTYHLRRKNNNELRIETEDLTRKEKKWMDWNIIKKKKGRVII